MRLHRVECNFVAFNGFAVEISWFDNLEKCTNKWWNGTVKNCMKIYISVHRTDATLLATNVDWGTCRVDSVNRKKGG